jgi:hypothetical protein
MVLSSCFCFRIARRRVENEIRKAAIAIQVLIGSSSIFIDLASSNCCEKLLRANGVRYPLVGGMGQRYFAETSFKPRKLSKNAQTPTSRVHAVLGAKLGENHPWIIMYQGIAPVKPPTTMNTAPATAFT